MRRGALITGLAGTVVVALTSAAIATTRGTAVDVAAAPPVVCRGRRGLGGGGVPGAAAAAARGQLASSLYWRLRSACRRGWRRPRTPTTSIASCGTARVQRAGQASLSLRARRARAGAAARRRLAPRQQSPAADGVPAAAPRRVRGAPLAAQRRGSCHRGARSMSASGLLLYWGSRDPRRALVWGWSPLVAVELAQNGHLDGIAVALLVGAADGVGARARGASAGALVAGALWPVGGGQAVRAGALAVDATAANPAGVRAAVALA